VSTAATMARLVRAGLDAVGIRIPVEIDGDSLAVRDLLLEFDDSITCHSVSDGTPRQVFSMPLGAIESAACAVVVRIVSGVVARAVEGELGSGARGDA